MKVNEHKKLSCSVPRVLRYRETKATADIINNKTDLCTYAAVHNTDHSWACPILEDWFMVLHLRICEHI